MLWLREEEGGMHNEVEQYEQEGRVRGQGTNVQWVQRHQCNFVHQLPSYRHIKRDQDGGYMSTDDTTAATSARFQHRSLLPALGPE